MLMPAQCRFRSAQPIERLSETHQIRIVWYRVVLPSMDEHHDQRVVRVTHDVAIDLLDDRIRLDRVPQLPLVIEFDGAEQVPRIRWRRIPDFL